MSFQINQHMWQSMHPMKVKLKLVYKLINPIIICIFKFWAFVTNFNTERLGIVLLYWLLTYYKIGTVLSSFFFFNALVYLVCLGTVFDSNVWITTLRFGEVETLVQCYTASKWQGQSSNFIPQTQIHSLKNFSAYLIINFLIMTYPGGKTIILQLAFEVDIA